MEVVYMAGDDNHVTEFAFEELVQDNEQGFTLTFGAHKDSIIIQMHKEDIPMLEYWIEKLEK